MHKLGITKFWGALVHILPFRLPKEIQGTVDAVGDASIRVLKKKKATFEKRGNETEDLGKDIINILREYVCYICVKPSFILLQ